MTLFYHEVQQAAKRQLENALVALAKKVRMRSMSHFASKTRRTAVTLCKAKIIQGKRPVNVSTNELLLTVCRMLAMPWYS